MKRLISVLLCFSLCLALPACRTESDEAWEALMGVPKPASTPAPMNVEAGKDENAAEDGLQGTLTISQYVSTSTNSLVSLATEFMKEHPGVTIRFENYINLFDLAQSEDKREMLYKSYQTQLGVELITGQAADIIISTEGLSLRGLAEGGVLRDLNEYWERDMNPEEFITPVTDLGIISGKRCLVPFNFSANMVYVNKWVSDRLGLDLSQRTTVQVEEMLDWYNQAREQGLLATDAPLFFDQTAGIEKQLFNFSRTGYLDMESRTARFTEPSCIRFLQKLQTIPFGITDQGTYTKSSTPAVIDELIRCRHTGAKTEVINDPSHLGFVNQLDYVEHAKEGLFSLESLDDIAMRHVVLQPCDYLEGPFLLADSAGRVPIDFFKEFAITSSCQNPELAWAFIRHCLGTRESIIMKNYYPYNGSGICVNRQNQKLMGAQTRLKWGGQLEYTKLEWYWKEDADPEEVDAALYRLLDAPLVNYRLYNMEDVNGYLDEFLVHQLTTAEQCAQKLQKQAYIWLNE